MPTFVIMDKLHGIGASSGIAIAPAHRIERGEISVVYSQISENEIENEIERFRSAIGKSKDQLVRIQAALAKTMGEATSAIIEPQIMLMSDVAVIDETIAGIRDKRFKAEYAFDQVMSRAIHALAQADDETLSERTHDFRDVRTRVLSNLLGMSHHIIQEIPDERILVIRHLAPSETAQLFGNKFVGIVCEMGGRTSHVAIMARTMEIPCVLGAEKIVDKVDSDAMMIIDGEPGEVIIEPDKDTLSLFEKRRDSMAKRRNKLFKKANKPAITKDKFRLTVGANLELPGEAKAAVRYGADGVGLFRTELIYTSGIDIPSQDEQTEIYSRVADKLAPNSVVIRTFDIGGDKFYENFDSTFEQNPFLGWRAIRIGLARPELLKTQMKAILRAAYNRNIKMMFPMISNREEVVQAKKLLEESRNELLDEGKNFSENLEVGIMVEVPSAAIMAREIASLVDFFSIGTNDLIQYVLAVDRGNQKINHLYQSFNPAVLKLIKYTIDSAHLEGIWCGMCGEMASDPIAVMMLVGMGLDELSVVPPAVPKIKEIIRNISMKEARDIAKECTRFTTHEEVANYLTEQSENYLPKSILEDL